MPCIPTLLDLPLLVSMARQTRGGGTDNILGGGATLHEVLTRKCKSNFSIPPPLHHAMRPSKKKNVIFFFFFLGGGPYSTIEYGPGSIEKLLYEV